MLEKGKFLLPSSPNPEPSNSKFNEKKKICFLSILFCFGSVLSPSICKREEVQDNTWFYWRAVKYAVFALKTLSPFSHGLIHNLSHVQAWQRVLNQSYIFGLTYFPGEGRKTCSLRIFFQNAKIGMPLPPVSCFFNFPGILQLI